VPSQRTCADVGPGISITLLRANFGGCVHVAEASRDGARGRPHPSPIAIEDELSRTALGASVVCELGWRLRPWSGWSLTPGVRYSTAWFDRDLLFLWRDVAAFVTIERETVP
jgi:hypothetical protein